MNSRAASAGFVWPVRVYWEDTDAGGVVFYANYLRYLERARTEWCRAAVSTSRGCRPRKALVFTVVSTEVQYHRPARLDDLLAVTVDLEEARRVSLVLRQEVRRESATGGLLVSARVRVACVDAAGFRPRAFPAAFRRMIAA